MPRRITIAVLQTALLVLAAVLGAANAPTPERSFRVLKFMFLAFGMFNVVVMMPGTGPVRAISVAAAAVALLLPDATLRVVAAILCWLAWPPAFFTAAWSARAARAEVMRDESGDIADRTGRRARAAAVTIVGAVAVASLAFRAFSAQGLQQTSALFVGIPTFLATAVVLFTTPRTAIGVACKAVTVGLLVSLIFLGEGLLCVAMSAPLFYAVAVFVGRLFPDAIASAPGARRQPRVYGLALLALLPLSVEGVHDRWSFSRHEAVSVTRIVPVGEADVRQALLALPRFDRTLPAYLRAGFPRPTQVAIDRSGPRPRWIVHMRGGETRLNGQEPAPGDLVLELVDDGARSLTWRAVSDTTHMTHFLDWDEASVSWHPIDSVTTRVTWTLRYRRGLDPAWYFGPWERYAVRLAAGYLIDAVATP